MTEKTVATATSTTCFFCRRRSRPCVAARPAAACAPCLVRIAHLCLRLDPVSFQSLWDLDAASDEDAAADDAFPAPADAVARLQLAVAYKEMGLDTDSVREAATAIVDGLDAPALSTAAGVMLTTFDTTRLGKLRDVLSIV